jgi:hypothetical protein
MPATQIMIFFIMHATGGSHVIKFIQLTGLHLYAGKDAW